MTTIASSSATPKSQVLPSAAAGATSGIGADFNMFLKLLVTQMQNQDPLNPMDSTQYTQQLAQYSQVEQTVQQTGTLKEILARLSTQDMSQAAGFIGKEAVFSSPVSGLGASPAKWTYTADRALTTGTATISDASGATVFTRALDHTGTTGNFSWDGTLADGTKAPDGAYSLSIKGVDAAGIAAAVAVGSTGTVNDVSAKNGILSLGVNGVSMSIDTLVRLAAGA
jgi:flagellar basal-body rod modification protein FlgD